MKQKRGLILGLIVMLLAAASAAAYPPVVITGMATYLGNGSSDPDVYTWAFGPQLDVDFRAPAGKQAYLGAWYSGALWFAGEAFTPIDQQNLGVLAGGPLGGLRIEARAATALSTPLGDDQFTLSPEWSVSASLPLAGRLGLEAAYSGRYNLEPDTDRGQLHNAADLAVLFDPSIELGLRGGGGTYLTNYTDRFVLDPTGAPTTALRRDIGAEISVSAEGLIGYFSQWEADITASLVESNANRLLAVTATIEENSSDRIVGAVSGSVSANPAQSLGLQFDLGLIASRYPFRSALDANGAPVAPTTTAGSGEASLRLDWNPFGRVFVILGIGGEYAISNDASMTGWNYTCDATLQYKL